MNIMAQCDHSHLNKMEAERRTEINKLYDFKIAGTGLLVLFDGAFIVWRLHSSELLARLYSTMKICSSSCLISQECL